MRALFLATSLLTLHLVLGQEFQCALEKIDFDEYCVFRNVVLRRNMAGARFTYPSDIAKPSHVAFVDSNMKQLPSNFFSLAGPELKVLRVENCGLVSVTIPSGLEALHAKDNSIEKVIVHQSGPGGSLRMLDLSGNQLSDFSNVTKCQALEELSLSRNGLGDVLDLGKFRGLNNLRKLDVSRNDINYLDNIGNVNLESLEDLDLSHNNLLPSDLKIEIFYPYTKLHTLRFNDNIMAQLDYNYLLNIKSLKFVYLNGNNFQCKYLDSMLNHLQRNNLQTPPGENRACPENTLNEFCCTGPLPVTTTKPTPVTTKPTPSVVDPAEMPTPTPRTTTTTTTTTEQPSRPPSVEDKEVEKDGGFLPTWQIIAIVFSALTCFAVLAGVVILLRKKSAYKVPPGNVQYNA